MYEDVYVQSQSAMQYVSTIVHVCTVKPVLGDHCHERPPVLTDRTFLAEEPTLQYN